jgi:hypothetical protein
MPRYDSSPANVQASIEVFPKDDYLFIIGEPKPFFRVTQKGTDSYGVRLGLTVRDGSYEGKRTSTTLYYQSEGAQAMSKQFIMAALGYGKGKAEEQRFNQDWGTADWSFDTDAGTVGDAWRELTGKLVVGSLDVQIGDNGDEQQQFKGWRAAK